MIALVVLPIVAAFFLSSYLLAGCSVGDALPAATSANGGGPPIGQRIGFTVGDTFEKLSDSDLEASMADIASLHVGWLRFEISWTQAQPQGPDQYDWSQFDRIVAAANRHGIKLLANLTYTPQWARLPACADAFQCAPADPAQFARFAGAAAEHFKADAVHYWEIWNEPNIVYFWKPKPDARVYTELLKQTYMSIKRADPQAVVISGGLSPVDTPQSTINPVVFLRSMYKDGAKNYMDAVGYHPYSFPALPSNVEKGNWWSAMSDLNPSLRSVMAAFGDSNKKIWATEYGVPTAGPLGFASEDLQKYSFADAINEMSGKPWLATLFFHTYKDSGTDRSTIEDFFGVVRYDGSRKPAYYVIKQQLAGSGNKSPSPQETTSTGSGANRG
ncbi:MAG: cellulase family glycosylhydrolase [Actinobacteria bacterium]|nr:cellulase family glycosylhydrolase [Actinomycetota bacterium]